MSDITYPSWSPSTVNAEYNHKASEANAIGDLAWYDSTVPAVRKASTFADSGTAAATQAAFAALFAGRFLSKQLSTDATAHRATVEIDQVVEFPCASTTFVAGDFVTPTYTAGVLSDQQVTKTSNPTLAIGRVVKDYASATTKVKVRLTSRLFNGTVGDELAPGTMLSAVAASSAVTNTTTETAFDNSSVVIPANTLNAGDVIRVRAQGTNTSGNSTDTLTIKLKVGTTVIVATAAVDVTDGGGDVFWIDAEIVIRTTGGTGTFVAGGTQGLGVPGTVTAKPWLKASTTIDTTAAQTLTVTATWSVASASDSCRLDVYDVQVIPSKLRQ